MRNIRLDDLNSGLTVPMYSRRRRRNNYSYYIRRSNLNNSTPIIRSRTRSSINNRRISYNSNRPYIRQSIPNRHYTQTNAGLGCCVIS